MKRYRLQPNTATIAHPNDPELKIELSQPSVREVIVFRDQSEKFDSAEARLVGFVDFLAKHVRRVSGLVDDATDKAMTLEAPIDVAQVERITTPDFDCHVERDVEVLDADGKPTGQTERKVVREWFATYLVGRLMTEETFSVPLAPGPTRSTKHSIGA